MDFFKNQRFILAFRQNHKRRYHLPKVLLNAALSLFYHCHWRRLYSGTDKILFEIEGGACEKRMPVLQGCSSMYCFKDFNLPNFSDFTSAG